MDTNDWRAEFLPHTRQIKVNEIMGKLMIHQSHGDDDELVEVQKIAQSIEHKTYAGAASQEDYLQEISSMMLFIGYYWRTQALPESRRRSVNEITEVLRRHLPVSSQEGLAELHKIAVRFEEKVYNSATSETDYFRKIHEDADNGN
ncbi:uncharacterized protein LOC114749728 [Neltuma alba]|uniref:uncharacterized protein LOC114749728 n=1 Tax=Neltuma alba TaxID=207710 RepID=UPI0010A3E891|nr:uncharacterized protein LOC114749728 [Prosopis alba]